MDEGPGPTEEKRLTRGGEGQERSHTRYKGEGRERIHWVTEVKKNGQERGDNINYRLEALPPLLSTPHSFSFLEFNL